MLCWIKREKGFGSNILFIGGKNVVKHRMEIYACSYQIIRYHNQFNWVKMWNFYFADEACFKQSIFIFFFAISFINLLTSNEKGAKQNEKKKFHLGLGESIQQIGKRFLKLFFWRAFWPVKQNWGAAACPGQPLKSGKLRGVQSLGSPAQRDVRAYVLDENKKS